MFFSIAGLFLVACQGDSTQDVAKDGPAVFFDIKTYFQSEIIRLNQQKPKVTKKVVLQGEKDQIEVEIEDFQKELQIFLNSDINKLAWQEKYQADTTFEGNAMDFIRYEALDTTLRTKLVEIAFEAGQIQQIHIANSTESIVMQTKQDLIYRPESGYSIQSDQKTIFSEQKTLQLDASFVP